MTNMIIEGEGGIQSSLRDFSTLQTELCVTALVECTVLLLCCYIIESLFVFRLVWTSSLA